MIRLKLQFDLSYEVHDPWADFVFLIHASETPFQRVLEESLAVSQSSAAWELQELPGSGQRCLRLCAQQGPLSVRYAASVEISHHLAAPEGIAEVPVQALALDVLPYLYPSRYCQSDRLMNFAMGQFGHLPQGYSRAQAICQWVGEYVTFRSNTSVGTTSAVDTLVERVGVCRDFAHLAIALCRAINLPARFVTGTDYGADPALGPPDFHAYVEVFLGDRWYLFDPSGTAIPLGLMRLATGRDAADVAFATIFGNVTSKPPRVEVSALQDEAAGWVLPQPTSQAISTAR